MKSTPIVVAVLLLAPLAAALGVPGVTSGPWGAWITDTVDQSATTGYPSLAIREGSPTAIAYMSNLRIRLALSTGPTSWSVTQATGEYSLYPSLAYDPSGVLHLGVLFQTDANRLKYATLSGTMWTFETVQEYPVGVGTPGYPSKLAFDAAGWPHIVHRESFGGAGRITHSYKDGTGWHHEVIEGSALGHMDLALGADGRVHVVFDSTAWSPSTGTVRYAVRAPGGGWTVETAAASGSSPSIGVGADGVPHVAYRSGASQLAHATKPSGSWVTTIVDSTSDGGVWSSTKVGPNGIPQIAFGEWTHDIDPTRAHLKYATKLDGRWLVETVMPLGNNGIDPSLVLDAEGRPHIAHMSTSIQPWVDRGIKYSRPAVALAP